MIILKNINGQRVVFGEFTQTPVKDYLSLKVNKVIFRNAKQQLYTTNYECLPGVPLKKCVISGSRIKICCRYAPIEDELQLGMRRREERREARHVLNKYVSADLLERIVRFI